ncbi:MerR family regulatory protein [Aquimixticola soesokkakensis]|uniref:MerR family regulatory protein n=1 Tax=Aquimixticola soesokkakensis TaxID=1519096 RepID=A0A1Y5TPD8_9RHOB|nr:MerR family transcriptional regulator [Aquimixticola soesokkakensis]SLN65157.1 MerR family regulatory protein [Aquimixticola soesokkakensis]
MGKSPDAFRTISEVADWLQTPAHVLRFWESRFTQIKPVKRAGGRRYYRPADMALLGGIKKLLHEDGLTIRGVQKLLREEGVRHVSALSPAIDGQSFDLDADAIPEAPMAVDVPLEDAPDSEGKDTGGATNVVPLAPRASASVPETQPLQPAPEAPDDLAPMFDFGAEFGPSEPDMPLIDEEPLSEDAADTGQPQDSETDAQDNIFAPSPAADAPTPPMSQDESPQDESPQDVTPRHDSPQAVQGEADPSPPAPTDAAQSAPDHPDAWAPSEQPVDADEDAQLQETAEEDSAPLAADQRPHAEGVDESFNESFDDSFSDAPFDEDFARPADSPAQMTDPQGTEPKGAPSAPIPPAPVAPAPVAPTLAPLDRARDVPADPADDDGHIRPGAGLVGGLDARKLRAADPVALSSLYVRLQALHERLASDGRL